MATNRDQSEGVDLGAIAAKFAAPKTELGSQDGATSIRVRRGMNPALHGAGSKAQGAQSAGGPKAPTREYAQSPGDFKAPSPKSAEWLRDILTTRQLPEGRDAAKALEMLDAGQLSQRQVSASIDAFKDCPRKGAKSAARVGIEQREEAMQDEDLFRVVADLAKREAEGRLNEFGGSLLAQYRAKGRLSDRQVEVYLKGMDRYAAKVAESAPVQLPLVPEGRYAVESADGELTFYRVRRDKKGQTWITLKHGPQESEVPFTVAGYTTILQSIVDAGPAEAAIRFGRELGCCSRCAADLTNRISRKLGIGPICGGHFYADASEWKTIKKAAREELKAAGLDPDGNVEEGEAL